MADTNDFVPQSARHFLRDTLRHTMRQLFCSGNRYSRGTIRLRIWIYGVFGVYVEGFQGRIFNVALRNMHGIYGGGNDVAGNGKWLAAKYFGIHIVFRLGNNLRHSIVNIGSVCQANQIFD